MSIKSPKNSSKHKKSKKNTCDFVISIYLSIHYLLDHSLAISLSIYCLCINPSIIDLLIS